MSSVPERWALLGRGVEDNLPVVYVAREKRDFEFRLTVWKLVKRPNGHWYNVGQWISKGRFRITNGHTERTRALRLSDSQLDCMLRSYAEQG